MKNKITYLTLIVLVLLTWELVSKGNQTIRLLISSPSLSTQYFINNKILLIEATLVTSTEAILGLLIGTTISLILMIICYYIPKVLNLLIPILSLSQVIPIIVLAPLFILIFGMGIISKIAMATLISFFPVFLNLSTGFKQIESNIIMLLTLYKPKKSFSIRRIYLPITLPYFFSGLKISANLSVIGAIVAEFTGSNIGLGKNLYLSAIRLDPELMICSLILSSSIGIFLYLAINLIEGNIISWTK
jgi:NitT/TauT family transport system permease protein